MGALARNVTLEERLAFQNVVSRRSKFHYSELSAYLDAFVSEVATAGGTSKGPAFYSLNNVPMDEITDIEIFLPVEEASLDTDAGMRFHSYVEVAPLARCVVAGDFEQQTEFTYARLLAALEQHDLEINAPSFHVLPEDDAEYVAVYLGYASPEPETPEQGATVSPADALDTTRFSSE